jgi:glyoxylase-like metal-dependent hydrolase (beta-lactamase superfamily II)
MLAAIGERVRVPITTVVNTHSDGDHTWGNQLLEGREIIATRAAADLIRAEPPQALQRLKALAAGLRRAGRLPLPAVGRLSLPLVPSLPVGVLGSYVEAMLRPYDFSGVRVVPPTREIEGEVELDIDGRGARLIPVGPAHTPGDLIVHVADADVVFGADVLFIGVAPVMWAGPTANWIAALERIVELGPRVVVPGHGPTCGVREVEALRDYMRWVEAAALPRLAAGRSVPETARELLRHDDYRASEWAAWDGPERILITVATIDRHRRGAAGRVSTRERITLFARTALLAEELATADA